MNTAIPNIIKKYPIPDQKLLPKINLVWSTSKSAFILDCKTGDKIESPRVRGDSIRWNNMKNEEIYVSSGATLKYAYCKYHPKAQVCELAVVTMNSNRTGGARVWEYAKDGERYFINKEKQIFNDKGEEMRAGGYFRGYTYHNSYGFIGYIGILYRCSYNDNFMEEFCKMIGAKTVIVGNGRCMKLQCPYDIQEWFKLKSPKKTAGKVQKLLDDVTKMPHKDLSNICSEYAPETWKSEERWSYPRNLNDIIYFEKLDDQWSVLRYCYRQDDGSNIESYRVYVAENGTCKITKLNDIGEWVPAQNMRSSYRSTYGRIVNFGDMAKCKRLSYIMPIIEQIPPHEQMAKIVSIVKFPEIEKLCKMGYSQFADKLLIDNTVNANMKNRFGKLNTKAKTVFGEFGLNKYQLEVYANKCIHKSADWRDESDIDGHYYDNGILTLKKYYGEDISSMDNATFDSLLECTALIRKHSYRGIEGYLREFSIDGLRCLKNIARLSAKHGAGQVIRIFIDTLDMYKRIDFVRRPAIDWDFDSYSDIVRVHDALIEIRRLQDEENRARWNMDAAERRKKEEERRKKVDEKRKFYEYEEDNYLIRLPKDCDEIVQEGVAQHICIGGYTRTHSEGNTNLFFLRKKDDPTVPFYAIEMGNDKHIIQIHGFGNKWLGNDPDAIPTVVRWLRKHDICCDDKILLCTAKGYSSNRDYIAMPKVD